MMMVLITGACGGLGRAMAVECAQRGYSLFLTDMNQIKLEEIRQGLLRQYDVSVYIKACDLKDSGATEGLFQYIGRLGISLNMLLNIAGVDFEGSFLERQCSQLMDIVQLNVAATLRVTHAAFACRNPQEKFFIVNVSSLASLYPIPLKATYAASKRFLLDFSIALHQELKDQNASVLALCPGGLPTTDEALSGIAAQGLWGRLTTNSLSAVAHKTISKALEGKPIYIPGMVNMILSFLGKLVPKPFIAKLLYNRWRAAQAKWLKDAARLNKQVI